MFIIKYSVGSNDDYEQRTIFVTSSRIIASNYVLKFNTLVEKWKEYYNNNETPLYGTIQEIFFYQDVWECWFEEIEERGLI
jgi:hypothetical protein